MKIVNRKQFLKLGNVIYSKYEPCVFRGLKAKGDSWDNDFLYDDLVVPVDCDNSDEYITNCEIAEKGEDIKLDVDLTGRDGMFEEDQLFAVYSKEDVKQLIEKLKQYGDSKKKM